MSNKQYIPITVGLTHKLLGVLPSALLVSILMFREVLYSGTRARSELLAIGHNSALS